MAGHTALLVVHGIGAQKPGDTVDKLARGLRLLDPAFVPQDTRDGVIATLGGQSVRLYEVYWADLLSGDETRGAFQITELQSLSWFPWYNLRRGNYRSRRYSSLTLAWWCIALPVMNFFMLCAYYGAGLFAQIFAGEDVHQKMLHDRRSVWRAIRLRADRAARLSVVDRMLDEYVGDVFSYVNSAGKAFYRDAGEPAVPQQMQDAYPRILQRFYDQLVKAHVDGCDTIQIVAHSLGTVVTYHALSGFGVDPSRPDLASIRAAKSKIRRVYTIGSPLEKIRFFWPRVAPVGAPSTDATFRWDNFVSFFDPVSGMLHSFEEWGKVTNHRLLGGGFFLGHVVYEHSTVFLGVLAEGLCGRQMNCGHGLKTRVRDLLLLTGENLVAPAVLGVVLAVGGALFGLVAMLLPYLLSWVVRWFLPRETWEPIVDTASLVMLGLLVLAFLVGPAVRASRVHSRFWLAGDRETVSTLQV